MDGHLYRVAVMVVALLAVGRAVAIHVFWVTRLLAYGSRHPRPLSPPETIQGRPASADRPLCGALYRTYLAHGVARQHYNGDQSQDDHDRRAEQPNAVSQLHFVS